MSTNLSSRIATTDDLQRRDYRALRSEMAIFQSQFLAREAQFRSTEYRWPRDALNNWSRIWEYPYVADIIHNIFPPTARQEIKILDFGSGVTFFPYYLSKSGFQVTCCDTDPVCCADLEKANRVFESDFGSVRPILSSGNSIPLESGSYDLIYSVSVLEHIPQPASAICELHRLLKPNGTLILTVDLDLRGDREIGSESFKLLMNEISSRFDYLAPPELTHPSITLTSSNSEIAVSSPRGFSYARFVIKNVVRHALGKPLIPLVPYHLAVAGLVLHKGISARES